MMNTRFSYNLLQFFTQKRPAGFALPLVIMTGTVILVIGAAMLVKGTNDQNQVISKAKSQKAEAIAEAGITQYKNFLNTNRSLLTYPDCKDNRDSSGACPDEGTETLSWSLASNIVDATPPPAGTTCTRNPVPAGRIDATTVSTNWANASTSTGWKSAGDGQYKLMGYKYFSSDENKPNSAPGVAVLAIQGRSGDGVSEGFSQIHVAMQVNTIAGGLPPIPQVNPPGLWARSFNTEATVHGNVLDSSGCEASGNTAFPSGKVGKLPQLPIGPLPNGNKTPPLASTMGVVVKDTNGTPFPPMPKYPTNDEFTDLASKVNTLSNCDGKQAYPAANDKNADGGTYTSGSTAKVYKYRITGDCTLPADVTFGTASGQDRIIMYVDGDLNIGNNAKIAASGTNKAKVQWLLKTSDLDLGGNSQVGSDAPDASTATNWAFFLYDGTSVSLRGTPDYYAFIFAPKATADMRGNPKIAGALWVNSYQTKGAPPKVFQAMFKDDFNTLFSNLYADTGTDVSALAAPNLPGNVVNYSKQAVNSPIATPSAIPNPPPVVVNKNPTPDLAAVDTTCVVPSLTGITLTDKLSLDLVRAALAGAQLSEGNATLVTDTTNGVKSQTPNPGTTVNCGSAVHYTYVVTVPTTCTVPNINNVSLTVAQALLADAGLNDNPTSISTGQKLKTSGQSPSSNTSVTCGSTVAFNYRGPITTTPPTTPPPTRPTTQSDCVDRGGNWNSNNGCLGNWR